MATIFGKGLYCCICFEPITATETAWQCPQCKDLWDMCVPCGTGNGCPNCQSEGCSK